MRRPPKRYRILAVIIAVALWAMAPVAGLASAQDRYGSIVFSWEYELAMPGAWPGVSTAAVQRGTGPSMCVTARAVAVAERLPGSATPAAPLSSATTTATATVGQSPATRPRTSQGGSAVAPTTVVVSRSRDVQTDVMPAADCRVSASGLGDVVNFRVLGPSRRRFLLEHARKRSRNSGVRAPKRKAYLSRKGMSWQSREGAW